jgi:hypothetical protein
MKVRVLHNHYGIAIEQEVPVVEGGMVLWLPVWDENKLAYEPFTVDHIEYDSRQPGLITAVIDESEEEFYARYPEEGFHREDGWLENFQ